MKATITTTSQKLTAVISSADLSLLQERTTGMKDYKIYIENTGANDIYVDFFTTAAAATGHKVAAAGGEFSFLLADLQDLNLIADTGSNDIIFLIN